MLLSTTMLCLRPMLAKSSELVVLVVEENLTKVCVVPDVNSSIDSVDKSRKVDRKYYQQSDQCSPIDTVRVSIDAIVLIQHGNVELARTDNPVIGDLRFSMSIGFDTTLLTFFKTGVHSPL